MIALCKEHMCKDIHGSLVCNNKKLETINRSATENLAKEIVVQAVIKKDQIRRYVLPSEDACGTLSYEKVEILQSPLLLKKCICR